jgi:hypothetical protein
VMERRGITELIRSGRSLQNRGVQKINPRLQLKTQIVVRHDVECRRVRTRVKIRWKGCEINSNHRGRYRVEDEIYNFMIFQIFWSHNSKKTASF